jgi:hypothetical protein
MILAIRYYFLPNTIKLAGKKIRPGGYLEWKKGKQKTRTTLSRARCASMLGPARAPAIAIPETGGIDPGT